MLLYRLDPVGTSAHPAADPACAAEQADLTYVTHDQPGITRRKFGRGFAFYGPDGEKISDQAEIDRLNAMAIPPAYAEVWICADPRGHLQAVGIDDRGRKQYRYHEEWARVRDLAKFHKLCAFGRALPSLRRRVAKDLKLPGLPRDKVLAACVRLLDETFIRVGNADYAKSNGSFGLTTLQDSHAAFKKGVVRFEFTAKSGLDRELEVRDSRLAKIIKSSQDLPGEELLQYLDDAGNVHDIGSADVNAHLRDLMGDGFTAKDFRTWHATVLAAGELRGVELASSKTAINKQVVAAIDAVAEQLGNTRSVCRKCYVDPRVIEAFEDATLEDAFTNAPATRGLRIDERAVLQLLER